MIFRSICIVSVLVSSLMFLSVLDSHAAGTKYLVKGSSGPSALSPGEMAQILENVVIPSLSQLAKWEKQGKITGGLPVGQRDVVFIIEASSSDLPPYNSTMF